MRQRWSVITWFSWRFLDVWVLPGHLPASSPQPSPLTIPPLGISEWQQSQSLNSMLSKLFFQMIQAIQVLRFHLLELEKVSRKRHAPLWFSHFPLLVELGVFLTKLQSEHLERFLSNLLSGPSLKLLFKPRGSEDGWIKTVLPFKVAASPPPFFPPRHSGLFWNAANHLCYWTFSLLASLLGPGHALGASRENHSGQGVFTLLCSSIIFSWKHTKFLAYWIANANAVPSSWVLTFWCYHQIGFSPQGVPAWTQLFPVLFLFPLL